MQVLNDGFFLIEHLFKEISLLSHIIVVHFQNPLLLIVASQKAIFLSNDSP
mgnify:CR=1 FL=1